MKRAFAIVLLAVHLFNIGGYNLFYRYFINRADVQMAGRMLSSTIDQHKLIELKIPVHFETIYDDQEYRMVTGQVKYQGVYYNYMETKTTRDTMYFVCLPNNTKTRLEKANNNITKEIADAPVNKKGHDSSLKKIGSLSEYNLQPFSYSCSRFGVPLLQYQSFNVTAICSPFVKSPGKPPSFNA